MASAKMVSAIDVRIDDVGSILKLRIGFPFGENSAGFCQSVWFQGSILNFRIGSVSSIGGLIAATLSADVSDSQTFSMRGCQTPARYWIKFCHPWVQELYPVLGLGSGGRLLYILRHFQTPALY